MKTIQAKWIVAAALLLLLGGVGFYLAFEHVDKTVRDFPSEEAIQNPYLALERLVRAAGFESKTLPYIGHAKTYWPIFLADSTTRPTPEQVEEWADWVEQRDGHLILALPEGQRDALTAPLVARLGFEHVDAQASETSAGPDWPLDIQRETYRSTRTANRRTAKTNEASEDGAKSSTSEDGKSEQKELLQRLNGWVARDANWLAIDDAGMALAASRTAGRGRVTLLRSAEYFDNTQIGDGEYASLAMDIAHSAWAADGLDPDNIQEEMADFTIVLHGERHSWMAYVLGFIWPALATLFIMLIFAILRGGRRFGPALASPPAQRRSRMEHIAAVGRFLWNHDASEELVLAAQGALLAEMQRRNPQLQHATGEARWQIIADLLDIDTSQARQLFKTPQNERRAERFTAHIRALENYRRQL